MTNPKIKQPRERKEIHMGTKVTKEVHDEAMLFTEVNWSEVLRKAVNAKLEQLRGDKPKRK